MWAERDGKQKDIHLRTQTEKKRQRGKWRWRRLGKSERGREQDAVRFNEASKEKKQRRRGSLSGFLTVDDCV